MATISIIKLKVRRGTDTDRKLIVLDNGELGYVTDASSKRLFVGDGVTKGGSPVGMKFFSNAVLGSSNLATSQVGDLFYNASNTSLYTLTGVDANGFPDYSNTSAYKFVGPRTDNTTISYTSNGRLQLNFNSVSASNITNDAYDLTSTGALKRTGGGKLQVFFDNNKIISTGSGLTVQEASLNTNSFNFDYSVINSPYLRLGNLPTNAVGLSANQIWRDASGYLRIV